MNMAFPSISTKATNIEMTPQLERLLEQKITSLEKFLPEGETDLTCDIELKKEAVHQSGRIYRAEINLLVGGKMYRAVATEEQIEKAIDEIKDEVKRELNKASSKQQSLMKKGGRAIKNMILGQ